MPHPSWTRIGPCEHTRPRPPGTLSEAEHGSVRRYRVVENGANAGRWQVYLDDTPISAASHAGCAEAMAAADQDALIAQTDAEPDMVRRLGLDPVEWRFDFASPGLGLVRRHDPRVTLRRIDGTWHVHVGGKPWAVGPTACLAADAHEHASRPASPEMAALRADLAAFAASGEVGPSRDDTDDWLIVLDAKGRLVLADVHSGESCYVLAAPGGFRVLGCRTVDLLDPAMDAPGSGDGRDWPTPREAFAAMMRDRGFAPPSVATGTPGPS